MARSMQVDIVRVSNLNFADQVASDECDPLNILIAAEENNSEEASGYGEHSLLVHHEPITFSK